MVIDPMSFFFGIVLTLYVIKAVKLYKEAPTEDRKNKKQA